MGLNFRVNNVSQECSWSYGGFHGFRQNLWAEAGFSGDLYELYDEDQWLDQDPEEHPLFELWNHSDCDGELTPEQLTKIAPALRELCPRLRDDYDRTNGLELADSMEEAIKQGLPLEFT